MFSANHDISGQGFNPYQNNYQGWNGSNIRRSAFRGFLNKFSLNVSLGYGRTFYKPTISNAILETPDSIVLLNSYSISGNTATYSGVSNWLNSPDSIGGTVMLSDSIGGNRILANDTTSIAYRGSGFNIPLTLSLHIDIIKRFRLGVGGTFELHGFRKLRPVENGYFPYQPNFKSTLLKRYFFTLGGRVYDFKGWVYHLDLQIGKVLYRGAYDKNFIKNGVYFNIGVPIEYEYSEYFFVFVRPSFDIKNYKVMMPQGESLPEYVKVRQPALYVNFGVRLKFPEIPRCPVKSCSTQMKHVHGSKEFRGQPFYKKQNPKIGELYPELHRNKGRNKKKMGGGN